MTTEEQHVEKLMDVAVLADLEGLDLSIPLGFAETVRAYNGIGAEWLPADVREKVTEYLALFEPAALIHDCRYHVSDGSRESFNQANAEFLRNCMKLAEYRYGFFNWRRYRAKAVAHVLYDCVSGQGGWKAWCEAYELALYRERINA